MRKSACFEIGDVIEKRELLSHQKLSSDFLVVSQFSDCEIEYCARDDDDDKGLEKETSGKHGCGESAGPRTGTVFYTFFV